MNTKDRRFIALIASLSILSFCSCSKNTITASDPVKVNESSDESGYVETTRAGRISNSSCSVTAKYVNASLLAVSGKFSGGTHGSIWVIGEEFNIVAVTGPVFYAVLLPTIPADHFPSAKTVMLFANGCKATVTINFPELF